MLKEVFRKSYLVIILITLLLPAITSAVELKCYNDGSIMIFENLKSGKVKAKQKGTDDPYIPVKGRWENYEVGQKTYYFISDEAQFIVGKPTRFYLKIGKKFR